MQTMAMQQILRYMIEECVSLLTAYLCYDADYVEIIGDFQHHFPNWPVPMRQMICRLNKKFQRMGLVGDASQSSCLSTTVNEGNMYLVVQAFVETPKQLFSSLNIRRNFFQFVCFLLQYIIFFLTICFFYFLFMQIGNLTFAAPGIMRSVT